jgi:hypothetical protein
MMKIYNVTGFEKLSPEEMIKKCTIMNKTPHYIFYWLPKGQRGFGFVKHCNLYMPWQLYCGLFSICKMRSNEEIKEIMIRSQK